MWEDPVTCTLRFEKLSSLEWKKEEISNVWNLWTSVQWCKVCHVGSSLCYGLVGPNYSMTPLLLPSCICQLAILKAFGMWDNYHTYRRMKEKWWQWKLELEFHEIHPLISLIFIGIGAKGVKFWRCHLATRSLPAYHSTQENAQGKIKFTSLAGTNAVDKVGGCFGWS